MLLATSMMTAASIAAAQDEAPPTRAGADIITVTAQKRSESIQDVPISIIALGTQSLDELQISQFSDYAKFIPSLTFQSTGPNSTTVYFRGVVSGGDGNHSASLPSVGIYLDEQPVTTILGSCLSTSMTSSASRALRVRKARFTARARSRAFFGSSPTSPIFPASPPATILRAITSRTATPAISSKAS
ncbi:MAG: hypothetical protein HC850_15920 [Rhodomicrobium sp.]|nr:hypothetical protein [Rhodomicrobium sp.]